MTELLSSLPVVELRAGSSIVFNAIDPTTGFTIAGVTVSNVAITYRHDSEPAPLTSLPPLFTASKQP